MNSDLVYADQQALKKISYTYGVHSLIGCTVDGTRLLPCLPRTGPRVLEQAHEAMTSLPLACCMLIFYLDVIKF